MKIRDFHFVLILATVLCVAISDTIAQTTVIDDATMDESEKNYAEFTFEETSYDFGKITEGESIAHVFTFTNNSAEPLVLVNVKGSCGCTVPQWPREPIAPGETASLTVNFNSKGRNGMQSKRVTITANTSPGISFLSIRGEVIPRDPLTLETVADDTEIALSPDCFAIYPNPTAEILKLDMEESAMGKSVNISIFSDGGQLMAKREIEFIAGAIEFNVSHYPSGTYVARVQVGEGVTEAKCFVVVD